MMMNQFAIKRAKELLRHWTGAFTVIRGENHLNNGASLTCYWLDGGEMKFWNFDQVTEYAEYLRLRERGIEVYPPTT
jgi:hypothetical protein